MRANAICREYNGYIYADRTREEIGNAGAEGPKRFLDRKEAEIAKLRDVMSSASEFPGAGAYVSDLAAQDRLLTALIRDIGKGYAAYLHLAVSRSYRDQSRKLEAKFAADERALRLTACIGPRSRSPIAG